MSFLRGAWLALMVWLIPLMMLGLRGYWLVLYAAVVLGVMVTEFTLRRRQDGILRE